MKLLAEVSTQTNENPPIDGIPMPNGADGLLAFIPLFGWLIAYGVRETIKVKIENIKAEAQAEREREKAVTDAELERERAQSKERADLVEELREQNRMFVREILNLSQAMENSGPLIEPPSKIRR